MDPPGDVTATSDVATTGDVATSTIHTARAGGFGGGCRTPARRRHAIPKRLEWYQRRLWPRWRHVSTSC
eukprot:332662-Chlamydomonas_euryale.AAC.1